MKLIVPLLVSFFVAGVAAQGPPGAPMVGPGAATVPEPARTDLWQLLTPEQREHLWRVLTPEQKSNVWRGLPPQERREMRERLPPGELRGPGNSWGARRSPDRGDESAAAMMTAEERQQMREQIREAHRLRRERMEAERARRPN